MINSEYKNALLSSGLLSLEITLYMYTDYIATLSMVTLLHTNSVTHYINNETTLLITIVWHCMH